MKAAIRFQYGTPDVIQIADIPRPIPKADEILIRVMATSVNRTDSGFLLGKPYIARLYSGLIHPRFPVMGNEFAGVVESAGSKVENFRVGDRVFGFNDGKFGAHAEYICIKAKSGVAIIPENISFETAAISTEGAHYALCDIRAAKIKAGQKILVNGATGAIGSAAVQLIKHLQAHVTAVCAAEHIEQVKSLGADVVINYKQEDFTKRSEKYDVVFDAVGKSSFGKCRNILTKKGIYMSTELGPGNQNPFLGLIAPLLPGKKVLFPIPFIHQEDVEFLASLLESGAFQPLKDRTYALEDIQEAYRYVLTGMKTGNVVINIM